MLKSKKNSDMNYRMCDPCVVGVLLWTNVLTFSIQHKCSIRKSNVHRELGVVGALWANVLRFSEANMFCSSIDCTLYRVYELWLAHCIVFVYCIVRFLGHGCTLYSISNFWLVQCKLM